MNIWRSLAGSVVDRSMLGWNDDVTCFGPMSLERERPLGADNHSGLCLILQTLIYHFRWSQRSLALVGLWAWCTFLNLIFFFIDLVETTVDFLYIDLGLQLYGMRHNDLGYAGKETLFVFHMKSCRGGVRFRKWDREKRREDENEGGKGRHIV